MNEEYTTNDSNAILKYAHQYRAAGFSLLPIKADGSKQPDLKRWKPLQTRLPTAAEVHEWFSGYPELGIAVIGGIVSGSLEVIDFDDEAIYREWLAYADLSGLRPLIDRIRQGCEEASPRGFHLPYYCETIAGNQKLARRPATSEELASNPDETIKGMIETRGEGGYVIVAPSAGAVHVSGKPYTLIQGSWLTIVTITPEERDELLDLCRTFDEMPAREEDDTPRSSTPKGSGRPGDVFAAEVTWAQILEPAGWIPVYQRGEVTYWRRPGKDRGISASTNYAGSDLFYCFSTSTVFDSERGYGKFSAYAWLYHNGDFQVASFALMRQGYGVSNGNEAPAPMAEQEEWTDTEADEPPPLETDEDFDPNYRVLLNLTDLGNGERLVARCGEELRYCNPWKRWLVWDGTRWQLDHQQLIFRYARMTARSIYEEAKPFVDQIASTKDEDKKKELIAKQKAVLAHAVKSEADARIMAMLHLGQMDVPILPDQLDRDPWLLNVANGTVDLRTGKLRAHSRTDLLTKLIPISYDPYARCDTWEDFLLSVMNSRKDMVDFLQVAIGYSLTGDVREDCLFLLHGSGANGKSTFLTVLRDLLWEYGKQAAFSTFLHQERETVRNDLADLQGARLVVASETDEGKKLSMSVIKSLTGKDRVKARFLFAEYFEYTPQMKLWLAANHKPVITGTDHGIWRRIRLIPFTQKFEGATDDKQLGEKLKAELPGILAWAIRGCLIWRAEGLPLPETIQKATEGYRAESDQIGNFLDECCEQKPHLRIKAGELYNAYVSWSSDKFITQTAFGRALSDRGIVREKDGRNVWRLGVALLEDIRE